jgi:DNA-directed RNA polymerase specialized sigma24 family protein
MAVISAVRQPPREGNPPPPGTASRQVAAALARLPKELRDTLLLVAWGDLSYEEVARALGIPVGTVRSRVSRARSKLRRTLGGTNQAVSDEESLA